MSRYPVQPLAEMMGLSLSQAERRLGISGSMTKKYRIEGVSEPTADRLATRAGFHPSEIWPDWLENQYNDVSRACDKCGGLYVPRRKDARFCGDLCRKRWWSAEMARRKAKRFPERERERKRRYYAETRDYWRAYAKRRYWAKKNAA